MEELKTFIEFINSIGFIGILILLSFPLTRKWLGFNGTNFQPQIDELKKHAEVANEEMGCIRKSIRQIEKDLNFIKGKLSK